MGGNGLITRSGRIRKRHVARVSAPVKSSMNLHDLPMDIMLEVARGSHLHSHDPYKPRCFLMHRYSAISNPWIYSTLWKHQGLYALCSRALPLVSFGSRREQTYQGFRIALMT